MHFKSKSSPIFLDGRFAKSHSIYRSPKNDVIDYYFSEMLPPDFSCNKVLDVGAGTGHFSIPLAIKFPQLDVLALEPSPAMASMMSYKADKHNLKNFRIVLKSLDELKEGDFDLIILSEVVHLFEDKKLLICGLKKKLSPNGRIVIRTPSHSQLEQRKWYKNFPSAKIVDIERHPSVSYLKALLTNLGFTVYRKQVNESRLMYTDEYIDMLANGGYSSMSLISSEEFEIGLNTIKSEFNSSKKIMFDYQMTVIVAML